MVCIVNVSERGLISPAPSKTSRIPTVSGLLFPHIFAPIKCATFFYALHGGDARSWGIIISTTFSTFPAVNANFTSIASATSTNTAAHALATVHVQHIFDLDPVHVSHSLILVKNATTGGSTVALAGYLPDMTPMRSITLLGSFMRAAEEERSYSSVDMNTHLVQPDDTAGGNSVLGSRLIPAQTYHNSPEKVGQVYEQLLDSGTTKKFKPQQRPILELISGPDAGAYFNEADVLEAAFQSTFLGPHYARLSAVKAQCDPGDLFIVGTGVGSKRWDEWGICRV
ncbi:hypothetical protein B0H17DRAFT_1331202 [Mycena rosella]|uniref:Berberine/berberine-like domain-containing protein n=1 Tax=Mycena rosella TaxID=1033263 RepID=A0AAD7GIV9_MYCRO|nr:hypothetical protein B0H17DRAFT_1331202 [Mycena rosella]